MDHDAFREEAEERLLGVEVGVEELVGLSRGGGVVMAGYPGPRTEQRLHHPGRGLRP